MCDQGFSRIDRVNNTMQAHIFVLLNADSIDERVWEIVEKKKALSDYLIDNKENEFADENLNDSLKAIIQDL